jgi:hypothetical protein
MITQHQRSKLGIAGLFGRGGRVEDHQHGTAHFVPTHIQERLVVTAEGDRSQPPSRSLWDRS